MNWWMATFILIFVIGALMTVFGFKKQSNLTLFFAYSFMLLPIFYALNWKAFVPFIAPISLVITYFTMKAIKVE